MDWKNLTQAPVWHSDDGFGGDGNVTGEVTVGHGRCVIDGPFANLEVQYYNEDHEPQCLSRGFLNSTSMAIAGSFIRPAAVEAVLNESKYSTFLLRFEDGPHSAIPISVKGEFSKFTAPNGKKPIQALMLIYSLSRLISATDPLFFLHHAQVDRLWWLWQQMDTEERLYEYGGRSRDDSDAEAALTDRLEMHRLAPDVPVSEVMDTENGPFCYRY